LYELPIPYIDELSNAKIIKIFDLL
jgi:hypothetical protein